MSAAEKAAQSPRQLFSKSLRMVFRGRTSTSRARRGGIRRQLIAPKVRPGLPCARSWNLSSVPPTKRPNNSSHAHKASNAPHSIRHTYNPLTQRARKRQARWERAAKQILETNRRENVARHRAVFTTVSLFFPTFLVAMTKPPLWQSFGLFGRA